MNDAESSPQIFIPRPRGQPREFDGSLSVRLTKRLHNELAVEAVRRHIDMSDVIRERLSANSVTQK